jgi:hypothetical protein
VAVLTKAKSFIALLLGVCLAAGAASAADPIPLDQAAKTFAEMHQICARDGGKFWGVTLCGRVLLVEPDARALVANSPDPQGLLKPQGGVFVGTLAPSENMSNAPMEWAGTRWTELIWEYLPTEPDRRHVTMAHEMFHLIQPKLGLTRPDAGSLHLDTLEGRYLTQLEWRALARALQASNDRDRRRAAIDALTFRAERYRLFPGAADAERDLEYAEGLAEYTGVMLGLTSPAARVRIALDDLTSHVSDASFVRTFAYATGPAYGLLLNRYAPGWRAKLSASPRLDDLLRKALHTPVPANLPSAVKTAAARYDDGALRASEAAREEARQKRLAAFRAKFIDGPVLYLPMHHANVTFTPMDLQPLDDKGIVYTKVRISADWGVLDVTGGALLQNGFKGVTVAVSEANGADVKGDGWTLTLKPGWKIVPGSRKGDYTVAPPPS